MSWIFIWWDSSLRRRNYDKKWAWESIFLPTWVFMHYYVVWIDALRGIQVKPEFPNIFLLYESWWVQRVAQNASRWKPCSILVKRVSSLKSGKQTNMFDILWYRCGQLFWHCDFQRRSSQPRESSPSAHLTSTNQANRILLSQLTGQIFVFFWCICLNKSSKTLTQLS